MEAISFNSFVLETENKEGIVLLGAGGDVSEWIYGVAKILKDEGISTANTPEKLFVEKFKLVTTGGRTDLALVIDFNYVEDGKLAMWRLRFGECSWISDYKCNYSNQHQGGQNG
jgi:hypothetical protein